MSTRGWYEYHVLDPANATRTLAMQFYKWGDARPENAVGEWQLLRRQLERAQGLLPVIWLDDLLREQLGDTYPNLPGHFSLGAFLFLIQRANEERSRNEVIAVRDLIAKYGVDTYALDKAAMDSAETEDRFWARACYEQPALIPSPKTTEGATRSR